MGNNFFNQQRGNYDKLTLEKIETLYNLQKKYLTSTFHTHKEDIEILTKLFEGYSRDSVLKAMAPSPEWNKNIDINIFEKSLEALKSKAAVSAKGLQNTLDALMIVDETLKRIERTGLTGRTPPEYLKLISDAATKLTVAIRQSQITKQKFSRKELLNGVQQNINMIRGSSGEYFFLIYALDQLRSLPKDIDGIISVEHTGQAQTSKLTRADNSGSIYQTTNDMDTRDVTFKWTKDKATISYGTSIKFVNPKKMSYFGISLRQSKFNAILPILAGKNSSISLGGNSQEILSAFTYGFHGLKYNIISDDDMTNIRKLMAVVLFTTGFSQGDLTRAIHFSIINDTFKEMTANNENKFFPDLDNFKLYKDANISQKQLLTIDPSVGMNDTYTYLARYVGLSTNLNLMNWKVSQRGV